MPALTLTYFDMPGRAKVLRRALSLGGVPFTNLQVNRDQFEAIKPSLPYGMVPILDIDDTVVAESQAIFRYIGRITGMYPPPDESMAALMVDEIIDTIDDVNERLLIPTYQEDDPEKKKQMRVALVHGVLRDALAMIDRRLRQISEYPFFKRHATCVFLHEMLVWDYVGKLQVGDLDHIPTDFVTQFETMMKVHEKVAKCTSVQGQRALLYENKTPAPRPNTLKITSFNGSSDRANRTRLALAIGGVAFEDECLSLNEFEPIKHALPNGQLPIVTVDGYQGAQSMAMLRFAGSLSGLYPAQNPLLAGQVDEIVSHIGELYFFFDPVFQNARPGEKESIQSALADDVVPESLASLDKRLAQLTAPASKFAIGAIGLTIADIAIHWLVHEFASGSIEYIPRMVVDPFTNVLRVHQAVLGHAAVHQWHANKRCET